MFMNLIESSSCDFVAILESLCFAATYKAVHTEIDINGRFDGLYPKQRARYGIV